MTYQTIPVKNDGNPFSQTFYAKPAPTSKIIPRIVFGVIATTTLTSAGCFVWGITLMPKENSSTETVIAFTLAVTCAAVSAAAVSMICKSRN